MKEYLIPKLAENKPVIVLDILGEYEGNIYEGFEDFMGTIREEKELSQEVHVVRWYSSNDAINTIRFVRHLEAPVSLVVEESHVLWTDSDLKKAVKKPMKEITMFGRHHGIDSILCSQRPSNIDTDVRSQAQFTVFFKLIDRADLEYARQKGADSAKAIENLSKTEFFTTGIVPDDLSQLKRNEVNSL